LKLPSSDRLYYSDSFLKSFTATVTEVRELARVDGNPTWHLSLDCTAFYPTSGGQPFDTGILIANSPGEAALEIPVEEVEEDEEGRVWHLVRSQLAAGTSVTGQINWDRRFDHMQQHSGQHLLSAVFLRELQMNTVSFHLGEDASTIDLTGGPLAQDSLERVERLANEIIGEGRAVTTHYISRSEAEAMLAAGELRKLPERQGTIRLIEIADCDRNACGGTHVCSTGQIGALLVRGVEKVSRGVRVEFVCGLRTVRSARVDAAILRETAGLLSIGSPDLPTVVGRLLADAKLAAKERQKLREELAAFQAAAMVDEVPIDNGLRLVSRRWSDRDRDYVKLLASRTSAAAPATAVIFCAKEGDSARVFVARSKDLRFDCGRILREALSNLGLRGGGSADLAQGEVPAKQEPALHALITDAIRKAADQQISG
jgi:alanyl-tRNA synthetase